MQLNQSQIRAVRHDTGAMLVAAGPGSGKTFVIAARIQYLIEKHGVKPDNILVITFTKAAAKQMKERFAALSENLYRDVVFGTFHSIFFLIIRQAYGYSSASIIQEDRKRQLIREIIHSNDLKTEDENELISDILSEISSIKGQRINIDQYDSQACPEDVFRKVFSEYESSLISLNQIDFDDILLICHELLKERSDILMTWQKKFKYILIDEFQDINSIQYEIIRMLVSENMNIFAVGDDDQSVYRFRGARPEIMMNFHKDFENSSRVILDTNYRSPENIVKASLNLIQNNKKRYEKKITADRKKSGTIDIRKFSVQKDENRHIVEIIRENIAGGITPGEIAVLYRTNSGVAQLIGKLMEYNIPFQVKDVMPNIFNHWISVTLIAYIRIALGESGRDVFLRVINRPNRYISRSSLTEKNVSLRDMKDSFSDKPWVKQRISELESDLNMLSSMNPFSAINYIRNGMCFDIYIKEFAKERRINEEELLDILDEIQEGAKEFCSYKEWFAYIKKYSEEIRKNDKKNEDKAGHVQIATMHGVKGLEFDVVFIPDAVEGMIPFRKAVSDEEIEEERRLFYVAVTRSKEKLHIYLPAELHKKETKCSRFVEEMLFDVSRFVPGTQIYHCKYGDGVIEQFAENRLRIKFLKIEETMLFDAKYAISNQILQFR